MAIDQSRRQFLEKVTGAGAALMLPFSSAGRAASPNPAQDPLFRISLAEWSLHRSIFNGQLNHLDFAPYTRSEFGIEAVEYVNQFFMDKATDQSYLNKMRRRADDAGVQSLLIMCDREGKLGNPNPKNRQQAVENHHKWVDASAFLGCHSIRVNAQSSGSYEEQLKYTAEGLRSLCEYGASRDINVIVENHMGGYGGNGRWIADLMEKVNHPRCGTLPDFGNWRTEGQKSFDPYRGVRLMMPYAEAVSAKASSFDDQGYEATIDYPRMMKIALNAGYRGYIGIEYEGDQYDEPKGISMTKQLLERMREKYAPEYE